MGVFMYGTVGIQHAVMAIYSAWCDRVPVVMFVGNDSTWPTAAAASTWSTARRM